MNSLTPIQWMITIVDRKRGNAVLKVLKEHGVLVQAATRGWGTANSEILNYLGLDETDKDIILSLIDGSQTKEILRVMEDVLHFWQPGRGIAFTLPVSGTNKSTSQKVIGGKMDMEKKQEDYLCGYTLVIAMVGDEESGIVMKAARGAGCTGGTITKARGVDEEAKKVFSLTIQPEKEIVMMLVRKEQKQEVMKAISNAVLTETGEPCVLFAVPVGDVTGLMR